MYFLVRRQTRDPRYEAIILFLTKYWSCQLHYFWRSQIAFDLVGLGRRLLWAFLDRLWVYLWFQSKFATHRRELSFRADDFHFLLSCLTLDLLLQAPFATSVLPLHVRAVAAGAGGHAFLRLFEVPRRYRSIHKMPLISAYTSSAL